MRFLPLLGCVVLTSIGAYVYGRRVPRLSNGRLSVAWKIMLECVWLGLMFLVLNLLVVSTGILAFRVGMGRFISSYVLSDVTLVVLSLLQGIVFQLWRLDRPS